MLMRITKAIGGVVFGFAGALVMLALSPFLLVVFLLIRLWDDEIIPMVSRRRSRPATEEELRKIIEEDRAKYPHTYHTPET